MIRLCEMKYFPVMRVALVCSALGGLVNQTSAIGLQDTWCEGTPYLTQIEESVSTQLFYDSSDIFSSTLIESLQILGSKRDDMLIPYLHISTFGLADMEYIVAYKLCDPKNHCWMNNVYIRGGSESAILENPSGFLIQIFTHPRHVIHQCPFIDYG